MLRILNTEKRELYLKYLEDPKLKEYNRRIEALMKKEGTSFDQQTGMMKFNTSLDRSALEEEMYNYVLNEYAALFVFFRGQ